MIWVVVVHKMNNFCYLKFILLLYINTQRHGHACATAAPRHHFTRVSHSFIAVYYQEEAVLVLHISLPPPYFELWLGKHRLY